MRIVAAIDAPLADEHVLATDPPLRPDLPGVWRRRINPFAGRSLSDRALTAEQDARAGMQRLRGQGITAGVINGLDVMAEPGARGRLPADVVLQILPGSGLTQDGEDIALPHPRRLTLADLPVWARADQLDAIAPHTIAATPDTTPPIPGGVLETLTESRPRRIGPPLGRVLASPASAALPRVAVLVAEPVTATLAARPAPPGADPRDAAFDDLQRIDGARLTLAFWPAEMLSRAGGSDYALPTGGTARRNRLAHRIFAIERAMHAGEAHPWEQLGVPLALLAFNNDWTLDFIDRASVVRMGGQPKPRTALVPESGTATLWQARVAQFVEHLADLPDLSAATLAANFRQLPPVGFLPVEIMDLAARRQLFFPAGFSLSAAPIPLGQVDGIVRDSAALVPINLDAPDTLELLVPVPDRVYEPGLLQTAHTDPAFTRAIIRYHADRTDWLVRRELVRRRRDRLVDALTGQIPAWPAADRAPDETLPSPQTRAPVTTTVLRASTTGATRTLHLARAGSTLELTEADRVFLWVRIIAGSGLTGMSIRLGVGSTAPGTGDFTRGVFWGSAAAPPTTGAATDPLRRGDLPPAGTWTRLEIPASARWTATGGTAAGIRIDGLQLTQAGGGVEWGAIGKLDAQDNETIWIADEAPPGALLGDSQATTPTWPAAPADPDNAPQEADFGTLAQNGTRESAALAAFRARWPQDFLTNDFRELQDSGVEGFVTAVEARLRATNDAVDLGFVRARADIYRVRQYMLGADAASRLVTSPALADLAVREEGARAKSVDLSAFVRAAYQTDFRRDPNLPLEPRPRGTGAPATPTPPGTGGVGGGVIGPRPTGAGTLTRSALALNRFSAVSAPVSAREVELSSTMLTARASRVIATEAASAAPGTAVAPQVAALRAIPAARFSEAALALQIERAGGDGAQTSIAALAAARGRGTRVADVQGQLPLPGAVDRTASVAERLKPSPAVEAHAYALAGKAAVVRAIGALFDDSAPNARPRGIALRDLNAPGYRAKAADAPPPTLADVLARTADFIDTDELPEATARHEADYFTAAVAAIDNAIALMRLVEGRVDLYNRLVADARQVGADIARQIEATDARLREIGVQLEEARHDLGVAQALLAEEQARVYALNQRRAAILQQHARTVLFRRPRRATTARAIPTAPASPLLAEEPAITCLRDHADVPEELHDYAMLFRDAPVAWFPALLGELRQVNRLDAARAALLAVRRRAALERVAPRFGTAPRLLAAVQRATAARFAALREHRIAALHLDVAAIIRADLSIIHGALAEHATLGDLIDGAHNRPALARRGAAEVEQIGQVAACLHASFAETPPAMRLQWAELLSEFDQPAPLAQLTVLADWAALPLDFRRTQQGLVDWLFTRIDRAIAPAEAAMNELVRIALLLAAHAPVDRIIPARLITPAPARPGAVLDVAVDITLVRIGMTAVVRGPDTTPIAHAVIDDLADGRATARITRVLGAEVTLTQSTRIEFGARRLV